jgi:DNA-directed RNA polymerase specialized sigma24 family protein
MEPSWDESVTRWIGDLKQGDDEAARQLWERYFGRLTRVARRRMEALPRREADEEDVALSVFDVLCRGATAGRFDELRTRDDLWRLLVAITAKKVVDQYRYRGRAKRGGGEVRGHSIMGSMDDGQPAGFDQFAGQEPSPEFLAILHERHQELLSRLRDNTLRQVAQMRMEGFSNQEIGERLEISLRSVERKLRLIREDWASAIDEE